MADRCTISALVVAPLPLAGNTARGTSDDEEMATADDWDTGLGASVGDVDLMILDVIRSSVTRLPWENLLVNDRVVKDWSSKVWFVVGVARKGETMREFVTRRGVCGGDVSVRMCAP